MYEYPCRGLILGLECQGIFQSAQPPSRPEIRNVHRCSRKGISDGGALHTPGIPRTSEGRVRAWTLSAQADSAGDEPSDCQFALLSESKRQIREPSASGSSERRELGRQPPLRCLRAWRDAMFYGR